MKLLFPRVSELAALDGLPQIALDMGFGAAKSCGVAASDVAADHVSCSAFGPCIAMLGARLQSQPESVLVVEAPLSGNFDALGNPAIRDPFERLRVGDRETTRRWYIGPGASTALAALTLFAELPNLVNGDRVVHVIEGFISFKTRSSHHTEDAKALLAALRQPSRGEWHQVRPPAGGTTKNLLSLAGLVAPTAPAPIVLHVPV